MSIIKKKPIRKREKVAFDTNVIVSALKGEKTSRESKKAIHIAKKKDRFVYLPTVDSELKGAKRIDKATKRRIRGFSKRNKHKIPPISANNSEETDRFPFLKEGGDRKIMNEAHKAGTSKIVTRDDKFLKANGKTKITILSPREYIRSRKKK